jgi:putative transposase
LDGTLERVHHALYVAGEQAGREASPTAAIIDAQSAKGALGSILRATTRQKEVDAMGLLWSAVVHPEMSRTVTAPSSCCDGRDDCFH